jgi:type I restriction enzyme, S subunit
MELTIDTNNTKTEIGSFPSDWNVKKLGEIGKFKKGKGINKNKIIDFGLPCVRYGELYTHHHEYIKKFNSFINYDTARESQSIKFGDILFAGSGETKEEIGKCAAYISTEEAYAGGDVIIFTPNSVDPLFLGFLLNHEVIAKQKAKIAQGDAIVHIYPTGLSKINVPFPPTKAEQTAIATALSDADALIQSLEKLIAKKRLIKQGAMQELLKPKEGWVVKKLGEVGTFKKGRGIRKNQVVKDGLPCVRYGELYTHHNEYIKKFNSFINSETAKDSEKLIKGDVLFAGSGETKEEIGKCATFLNDCEAYAGGDVIIFTPKNIDPLFLGFLLNSRAVARQKAQIAQGDAVVHIYPNGLSNIIISIPPVKSEQKNIANSLFDIDTEIIALEAKLEKYKQIKQGMVQNLLTGKIRLV